MVGPAAGPPALASTGMPGNMKRVCKCVCVCRMFVRDRGGPVCGCEYHRDYYPPAQTPWVALGLLPMEAGLHTRCVVGR